MANIGAINKTYERKMERCHVKEVNPQQPRATNNNTMLNMQIKQVGTTSPTPYQNVDIAMQLEAVTRKHNGSSLQLSTSQECPVGSQVQVANKERRVIHLAKNTPHPLPQKPRMGDTNHSTTPRGERQEETKE